MSCVLERGLGVCRLHCKSYYSGNSDGDTCISVLNECIRTVIYWNVGMTGPSACPLIVNNGIYVMDASSLSRSVLKLMGGIIWHIENVTFILFVVPKSEALMA